MRVAVAVFVASLVAPVLLFAFMFAGSRESGALNGALFVSAAAWVVSVGHLVVLGVPAFLLLVRHAWLSWATVSAAGFVAGVLPIGVLDLPSQRVGYSEGVNWYGKYVMLYENGSPTVYAWLNYGEHCLQFAVLGTVSALVMWRVWVALGGAPTHRAVDA